MAHSNDTHPAERIRVAPRNLTARAAYRVAGNPATTRPESSVGNCFPGLEMDVRDLDRRFFPGLVFNAVRVPLAPVAEAPKNTQGFHLVFVDYMYDPMLPADSPEPWVQTLLGAYKGATGDALGQGRWFLDWVEQAGQRITFSDGDGVPYDGMLVWRFIRSLECGPDKPLRIALVQRDHAGEVVGDPVVLDGFRRRYRTEDGVFDTSYQAGELTQSLCNPWSHDFRDCGCHYWPSNHPDVVMAEASEDDQLPSGQSDDPLAATTRLDWLRNDRGPAGNVAARSTVEENRPWQVDHYQINAMWDQLPLVVEGRETGKVYHADPDREFAAPYGSEAEMVEDLAQRLAPLEMALALQYLYAYFSLADPDTVDTARWPTLRDDLVLAQRTVLTVAIGEMTHLRWANQLLWELQGREVYEPVLTPAKVLRYGPGTGQPHPRKLQPLTLQALDEFIQIERPGGFIDTAYARCVATLKERGASDHLYALAVRIDTDGDEHYLRFRRVRQVMEKYATGADLPAYLRPLTPATGGEADATLALYHRLTTALGQGYAAEARQDYAAADTAIQTSRKEMEHLRVAAEALARQGIGIPFWPDHAP